MSEEGSHLQRVAFRDLFKEERLPSGHPYELMPDTVDTALKVAEVEDSYVWRKKALQAHAVTKSVGGIDLRGDDAPGVEFIHNMLDIDVIFLSLAWTAQLNGMELRLEEGVPCPSCAHPFMRVPFGDLVIWSRPQPVSGPEAILKVDDVDQDGLPKSVKGSELYVTDPTWKAARQFVAENSWNNPEVIAMFRAMTSLRASPKGGKGVPRVLSLKGEARQIRVSALNHIIRRMDSFVPHFQEHLDLTCEECGTVSIVPFEQGL